jgi:prephenate dehydratase
VYLFRAVETGQAASGIVPIENTLAGSVHENYDLLSVHDLHVVSETELRIRHCLIAPPRTTLPTIRRVASHPVALAQCRRFFLQHPDVVPVPAYDTAGSVRDVMAGRAEADAAIASKLAAELYGADVLVEGLEDHAENYTRFLVVAREPARPEPAKANKTSLILALGNTPGTLYRALGVFATQGLNLSKIESRPLPGRPWEYLFYVDVVDSGQGIAAALEELRAFTSTIRVLGTYPAR